ncbi:molybdenum cofactor guanylyltransferase [Specibacter cremeus]|uniref:molybdenum cofactor guanylyltransferase n=1 Tax=Specibacter cremeus TaxID=1629051 RepID=UPI000F77D517|nr:NTP transferase domain-containing protein [Specibacter cremeus]
MNMVAVVLAGGRSSRLDGVPKAGLVVGGQTLLARTVAAADGFVARFAGAGATAAPGPRIVVVGPGAGWQTDLSARAGVTVAREDPPFAGPAAGIAAGLDALGVTDGLVLVLACDMPGVEEVVARLAEALAGASDGELGLIAVDAGRDQPLAAVYPVAGLRAAIATARAAHRLENASVRQLVARVRVRKCAVPDGCTADVDTWADARRLGVDRPGHAPLRKEPDMDNDEVLEAWLAKLLDAFELTGLAVDTHAVLNVAGVAAHAVVRPAAPLTTFVAGLAAGLAAASGQAGEADAMAAALRVAKELAAAQTPPQEPGREPAQPAPTQE